MMKAGDEPFCLAVGTPVSAKYRGAFCEATVEKTDKQIKCRVQFKESKLFASVGLEQVEGTVDINSEVQIKSPDGQHQMAIILKIIDYSSYNVVFDDGDKRTLKRSQLVLKGNRHFKESESLDVLPLTNPEQFKNPVMYAKGRKTRHGDGEFDSDEECSSDEEVNQREGNRSASGTPTRSKSQRLSQTVTPSKKSPNPSRTPGSVEFPSRQTSSFLGHLVLVDMPCPSHLLATPGSQQVQGSGDKRRVFPGLVVLASASLETPLKHSQLLVKSFKDNKFFAVHKRDVNPLTREQAIKLAQQNKVARTAVEKAVLWLDNRELPASWDKEALLDSCSGPSNCHQGDSGTEGSGSNAEDDGGGDDSETESSEEEGGEKMGWEKKDMWIAMLYKFMEEIGSPMNKAPSVANKDLDLYRLNKLVLRLGGYGRVGTQMKWPLVYSKMGLPSTSAGPRNIQTAYKKYLLPFDDMNRKLGSTSFAMTSASGRRGSTTGHLLSARERRASGMIALSKPLSGSKSSASNPASPSKDVWSGGKRSTATPPSTSKPDQTLDASKVKPPDLTCATPATPIPTSTRKPVTLVGPSPTQSKEDETICEPVGGRRKGKMTPRSTAITPSHDVLSDSHSTTTFHHVTGDTLSTCSQASSSIATAPGPPGSIDEGTKPGTRVKVRYGDSHLYEAKVVRQKRGENGEVLLVVHYTGWNHRHDETVPIARIVFDDTDNVSTTSSKRRCKSTSSRSGGDSKAGEERRQKPGEETAGVTREDINGASMESESKSHDDTSSTTSSTATTTRTRRLLRRSTMPRIDVTSPHHEPGPASLGAQPPTPSPNPPSEGLPTSSPRRRTRQQKRKTTEEPLESNESPKPDDDQEETKALKSENNETSRVEHTPMTSEENVEPTECLQKKKITRATPPVVTANKESPIKSTTAVKEAEEVSVKDETEECSEMKNEEEDEDDETPSPRRLRGSKGPSLFTELSGPMRRCRRGKKDDDTDSPTTNQEKTKDDEEDSEEASKKLIVFVKSAAASPEVDPVGRRRAAKRAVNRQSKPDGSDEHQPVRKSRKTLKKAQESDASESHSEAESNATGSTVHMIGQEESVSPLKSEPPVVPESEQTWTQEALLTSPPATRRRLPKLGTGNRRWRSRRVSQTDSFKPEDTPPQNHDEDFLDISRGPLSMTSKRPCRRASPWHQSDTNQGTGGLSDTSWPGNSPRAASGPIGESEPGPLSWLDKPFVRPPDKPFVRLNVPFELAKLEALSSEERIISLELALRKVTEAWRNTKQELRELDRRRLKKRSKLRSLFASQQLSSSSPLITPLPAIEIVSSAQ